MIFGVFGLGGWEVILILAVVVILFSAKNFPPLGFFLEGLRQGLNAFRNASDEVTSQLRESVEQDPEQRESNFSVRLFVAQGFGVGWIPFAPGTFGSFLGLVWFAMLIATGNFWAYLAGCIEGVAFSIWLCDDAEKILGETDPGSVVLDEIIAIPFCFLPWVAAEWFGHGALPEVEFFFHRPRLVADPGTRRAVSRV
jgi:phosphatidylglycerophosphatase A